MNDDTPNSSCQVCAAPTGDSGNLCRTHTEDIQYQCRQIIELVPELETTICRQDKLTPRTDGRGSAETPLAWNEPAAQAAWELNCTLNAWALDISKVGEDTRDPLSAIPHHDTPELANWMRRNTSFLRMHSEAGQAHDEVTNAVARARRVIDHPANRTRFQVGPCPQEINDAACDGQVWAFISSSEDRLSYMRCEDCETRWDSTQWLRVGPRIHRRKELKQQQNRAA